MKSLRFVVSRAESLERLLGLSTEADSISLLGDLLRVDSEVGIINVEKSEGRYFS